MNYENPNIDTEADTEEEEILGVETGTEDSEEKEEEIGNILED